VYENYQQNLVIMKRRIPFLLTIATMLVLVFNTETIAQATGTISGLVQDANTIQGLPGASVILKGTNYGTYTESNGRYQLQRIPAGSYTLVVNYIGYEAEEREIQVTSGERIPATTRYCSSWSP